MLEPGAGDGVLEDKAAWSFHPPPRDNLKRPSWPPSNPHDPAPSRNKDPGRCEYSRGLLDVWITGGNSAVYGGSRGASIVVSLGLMPGASLYIFNRKDNCGE